MTHLPTRARAPGAAAVRSWQVQSSAADLSDGAAISQPGYRATGWHDAPARSTVMAALLHNGRFGDLGYSTRLRDDVDRTMFEVPWWFRTTFRTPATPGSRTAVRSDGIIPSADLWVNGVKVAGRDLIAGAYTSNSFDLTALVRRGENALSYLVYPGSPMTDLSIGWVDWNQWPPDNNMGIWRDVVILSTGPVQLSHPRVTVTLSPAHDEARLVVTADATNLSSEPVETVLAVRVSGPGGVATLNAAVATGSGPTERAVAGTVLAVAGGGTEAAPADTGLAVAGGGTEAAPADTGLAVAGGGTEAAPAGTVLAVAGGETEAAPAGILLAVGAGDVKRARAEVVLGNPAIWWPAGEGDQPLYDLEVVAMADGSVSDRASASFGVRSVTSDVAPGGGRRFLVNGRYVPVRGAGWCPDLFLRHDPQRIADELAYTLDIGLNTIRLEGKGENPEFFEMADEAGLLVLPGWECCNKWEAHACTGGAPWDDHDFDVAARSMEAEAYRLANHPSVVGFVMGSDFPPEPRAARLYVVALEAARWDLPIISSATVEGTEEAGPSGMKMTGPYAWVPPVYWYSTDPALGGAVGFNSETSAGNNVPRLSSLERMLSPEELEQLWREPSVKQFHAGPPSEFDNLEIFHRALAGRYGAPRSLRDFVAKAQLASYEATRAQFEAFGGRATAPVPATGEIYWMLNSAWPSLNWQLWDHFLDPSGAYFGAKKAHEPVHVQYAYDDRSVYVVNRTRLTTPLMELSARIRSVTGSVLEARTVGVGAVAARETVRVMPALPPDGTSATYFLELDLTDGAGNLVSSNVYWLSTTEDVLAVDETTWQYTPTSAFAELQGLESLGAPDLEATVESTVLGRRARTTVTIRNASGAGTPPTPAIGVHAALLSVAGATGASGRESSAVVPVLWSDNDILLFAGQSTTLIAECAAAALGGREPLIQVDAFNLAAPFRAGRARDNAETQ
jgi:exo-1,4-beta-D-glucosaminidase